MSDRLYWNAEMETISAADLERREVEWLRQQLAYLQATSPFYRAKFEQANITPDDLNCAQRKRQFVRSAVISAQR